MGKVLRFNLLCRIIVLLLVSGLFGYSNVHAQISVSSTQSFEVSFTKEDSHRSRNGVKLSLQDPLIKAGSLSGLDSPGRFTSSGDHQNGLYFAEAQGEVALGSYYNRLEDNTLSQLLFENGTSDAFRSLSVAFDFIFLASDRTSPTEYQLTYRVNRDSWKRPAGGHFSSDFLKSDSAGWGSFSMQISLSDLYMRPGDQLELRWRSTTVAEESMNFIPIALQKIELFPSSAEKREIRPGSIIISEILPRYETDDGHIEYIELYNSTDTPINLKGFVLSSEEQQLVVQSDLEAKPYSAVVIESSSGKYKLSGDHLYSYSRRLLTTRAGRIDIELDEKNLARALYEATEPGVPYRMDHLENAYDGYSGMRYFESVNISQQAEAPYSPGTIEESRKLFSKTISREGWHIIHPPGTLSENLNREVKASFKPMFKSSSSGQVERESLPLLYYHPNKADEVTLFSTGRSETEVENNHFVKTLKNRTSKETEINRLINQNGRQAFPALLSWDQEYQGFEIIWNEDHYLAPWQTYFFSSSVDNSYHQEVKISEKNSEESTWTGLDRLLELSIEPENENEGKATDKALVGFWDPPAEMKEETFNLPKMWNPLPESSSTARSTMIYLESAESEYSTNSYINLQRTPKEVAQFSIGYRYGNPGLRYRISWAGLETLPDHWDIQFLDTEIDERIDMRREQSYTFFDRSDQVSEGVRDPERSFKPVESIAKSRFVVKVSSSGALNMIDDEDQSPDSIELKQNYPNPFNPTTTIAFYLPKSTDVKVGVYNVVGQQVGLLKDERMGAGNHTVLWNAADMPSGVYIVQLETSNTVKTRKITLIK